MRRLMLGGLVGVTLLGACVREPNPDQDLDRLRSLPYLNATEEAADPSTSGVTVLDEARSHPGYNLYTIRGEAVAEIIDAAGNVVHRWKYGGGYWARSVILENGDLLVVGAERRRVQRGLKTAPSQWFDGVRFLMRLAWNGDLLWRRELNSHHDVSVAPDGNLLLLTLQMRSLPEIYPDHEVRDDRVELLSPMGETLAVRSLWDLVSARPDLYELELVAPRPANDGGFVDLFHANSVRWMNLPHLADRDPIYRPTNVVVSIRHQDRVIIFDWARDELLWAWGEGEISGPHDAVILEDGHLLIFDNGLGRRWSRVLELDPLTKEIVWEYHAPDLEDFYTGSRGANQRLGNGNTLITESDSAHAFEVTADGTIVWEYWLPANDDERRSTIIRLYRYDESFIEPLLARPMEE